MRLFEPLSWLWYKCKFWWQQISAVHHPVVGEVCTRHSLATIPYCSEIVLKRTRTLQSSQTGGGNIAVLDRMHFANHFITWSCRLKRSLGVRHKYCLTGVAFRGVTQAPASPAVRGGPQAAGGPLSTALETEGSGLKPERGPPCVTCRGAPSTFVTPLVALPL